MEGVHSPETQNLVSPLRIPLPAAPRVYSTPAIVLRQRKLGEADKISDNRMLDNMYFGLALFDGQFVIDGALISGGGGGLWVIAQGANTSVVLRDTAFNRLSGPKFDVLECCGFTATVTIEP